MSITKKTEDGCEITTFSGVDLQKLKENLTRELHGETPAGCCVACKQPFSATNVYSAAGWRETKLSGMCELCFDRMADEIENETQEDDQ